MIIAELARDNGVHVALQEGELLFRCQAEAAAEGLSFCAAKDMVHGIGVPDKVAKNRTTLQQLMVGLAVRSSRADSSRKDANSKSATGSTASWRRRANDANFKVACVFADGTALARLSQESDRVRGREVWWGGGAQ